MTRFNGFYSGAKARAGIPSRYALRMDDLFQGGLEVGFQMKMDERGGDEVRGRSGRSNVPEEIASSA